MDHEALVSRLRAACQGAKVPWTRDEDAPSLARKLVEAGQWEPFSEKYDMHFDPETGEFIDINELAHAMYVIETFGTEEQKQHLQEILQREKKED